MNDYTRKLLGKAVDTIESAELLLDNGKTDVAEALKDIGVCTARLHEGWILTIIHKYPSASLGSSQAKSSAI